MVIALVRAHRIGFLVDAAILGFAVGTDSRWWRTSLPALAPDARTGTWIVRGFGTAVMHGGATAIFAILGVAALDQAARPRCGLHRRLVSPSSAFGVQPLFFSPMLSTVGIAIAVPVL